MLAAVLHDFNQLVLEDVPRPKPGIGEVVVRVKYPNLKYAVCSHGRRLFVGRSAAGK